MRQCETPPGKFSFLACCELRFAEISLNLGGKGGDFVYSRRRGEGFAVGGGLFAVIAG